MPAPCPADCPADRPAARLSAPVTVSQIATAQAARLSGTEGERLPQIGNAAKRRTLAADRPAVDRGEIATGTGTGAPVTVPNLSGKTLTENPNRKPSGEIGRGTARQTVRRERLPRLPPVICPARARQIGRGEPVRQTVRRAMRMYAYASRNVANGCAADRRETGRGNYYRIWKTRTADRRAARSRQTVRRRTVAPVTVRQIGNGYGEPIRRTCHRPAQARQTVRTYPQTVRRDRRRRRTGTPQGTAADRDGREPIRHRRTQGRAVAARFRRLCPRTCPARARQTVRQIGTAQAARLSGAPVRQIGRKPERGHGMSGERLPPVTVRRRDCPADYPNRRPSGGMSGTGHRRGRPSGRSETPANLSPFRTYPASRPARSPQTAHRNATGRGEIGTGANPSGAGGRNGGRLRRVSGETWRAWGERLRLLAGGCPSVLSMAGRLSRHKARVRRGRLSGRPCAPVRTYPARSPQAAHRNATGGAADRTRRGCRIVSTRIKSRCKGTASRNAARLSGEIATGTGAGEPVTVRRERLRGRQAGNGTRELLPNLENPNRRQAGGEIAADRPAARLSKPVRQTVRRERLPEPIRQTVRRDRGRRHTGTPQGAARSGTPAHLSPFRTCPAARSNASRNAGAADRERLPIIRRTCPASRPAA